MLKFLFVIFFFFILLVFLMGFSILRTVKNLLFGSGNSGKKGGQSRQTTGNYSSGRPDAATNTKEDIASASKKKIFTKDEGEYVDYEEVK